LFLTFLVHPVFSR